MSQDNKKLFKTPSKEALDITKSFSAELTGIVDLQGLLKVFSKYVLYVWDFSLAFYLFKGVEGDKNLHYFEYQNKEITDNFYNESRSKFELTANVDSKRLTSDDILNGPEQIGKNLLTDSSKNNLLKREEVLLVEVGKRTVGYILLLGQDEKKFDQKLELLESLCVSLAASVEKMRILVSAQHSKTESLIESLGDGVLVVNQNKEIVLTNQSFFQIIKKKASPNLALKEVDVLIEGVNLGGRIKEVFQTEKKVRINEKKISGRFFDITISPVRDHQSKIKGASIIFHDISYLREIDEMKSQFVTVASHKLRTPLTAIKLYTYMLMTDEQSPGLQENQKNCLDIISQSTERMSRLVNDLLNMSDIESGSLKTKLQTVDFSLLVNSVLGELESAARLKGVEIVLDEKSKIRGQIKIDQNLLRQSIHSLVANAIEYSKEEEGRVDVEVSDKGGEVEVKIVDNGIGVPELAQKKLFTKFFRAENAQRVNTEGSGLGLYVAQKIIESGGGKIIFSSRQQGGAEFTISLPIKI